MAQDKSQVRVDNSAGLYELGEEFSLMMVFTGFGLAINRNCA
jgi:hypothetical protein